MVVTKEENNMEKTMMTDEVLEYKIEIATQTLERNIGFVTNCDNKTSIVLAVIGVLLTIILTNEGMNTIFNILRECFEKKNFCNVLYLLCFAVIVFVMSLGMFKLCGVLVAKTDEKAQGLECAGSSIFFSGIRKNGDYKVYKTKFCKMNKVELLDELIIQIYINADIATQKYRKYNEGLKLTIIGFVLFAFILVIGIYVY